MLSFGMHFLICNLFISAIIGLMLIGKKMLEKHLSAPARYHIWYLLPVLLAVPFLPIRPARILPLLFRWAPWSRTENPKALKALQGTAALPAASDWMNDLSVSVTREVSPKIHLLLTGIWILGMLVMLIFMVRSRLSLYHLEKSALPVQSEKVRRLFLACKQEMNIRRNIPVYSTAFLNSPVTMGFLWPRILIPIGLISDFDKAKMRYMLLHELQHYKHKDALLNHLLNLSAIVYWPNPLVWYAQKEARTDREVACDSFVLQMLDGDDYIHYGDTLLHFAEKISRSPFSLTAGMGGNAKQLRKRILNIASYHPRTNRDRIKECLILLPAVLLALGSTAFIPVLAFPDNTFLPKDAKVTEVDFSSFFAGQEGSAVLYDMGTDTWEIYNEPLAEKRVSPNSTYKIYSALFALEQQYITPEQSLLKWNGQEQPFPQWNQDQTLSAALRNSVNWYFRTLDEKAGLPALKQFYTSIGYGNHDLSGGLSEYWMESSLQISPLEQVELLKKLYTNEFHFKEENVQAVKNALLLSSARAASLYGKTGTGAVNGQNVNGWFVGYVETGDNTCFFAVNVQGREKADSRTASEIALHILAHKSLF